MLAGKATLPAGIDRSVHWLICSGAGQFLDIAAKLVGTGFKGGIAWEPDALRCRALLSQSAVQPHAVIVAHGCHGAAPHILAGQLGDAIGTALSIFVCPPGGFEAATDEQITADIVTNETGLFPVLLQLASSSLGSPDPEYLPDPAADRLAAQEAQAKNVRSDQEKSSRGLRATGSIPRIETDDPGSQGKARMARIEVPDTLLRSPGTSGTSNSSDPAVPTLCFVSARGGTGKSTLATTMALLLASQNYTVALLDLDFQFGTCLGFLGAAETDGLMDGQAPGSGGLQLDARSIMRCKASVQPNLHAFEFCRLPEQAELLMPCSGQLVQEARKGADIALVDLPSGMNEAVAQVLDLSDRCLLIGDQSALSLESLGALISLCTRAGVPLTRLVSVVNRCDARKRDETFLARARFELQTPQIMTVMDGGSEVCSLLGSGNAAGLLDPHNRMTGSLNQLVQQLMADLGCTAPGNLPLQQARQVSAGSRRRRQAAPERQVQTCPF